MNSKRTVSLAACRILLIVAGIPVLASADVAAETRAKAEQHFQKANELLNSKEYKAAIPELQAVMAISPHSRIAQDAQYWMGQSYFLSGRFDAAQATFARLIEQNPGSGLVPATEQMIERAEQSKEEKTLVEAIEKGDVEQLKLLISRGADINAKVKADADANIKEGWPLLNLAAWHGHADVAALLINKGADVNARMQYGITPLWYAVDQRHLDVIELLISRGADIESPTTWDTSALIRAAGRGHLDVVELLISKGADIQAKNNWRQTSLHYAAGPGHIDIVELLISKGADIEARSGNGKIPLHWAAANSQLDVVKLLLDKGVYIDSADYQGQTPLHLAIRNGHQGMVELLLANNAAPWRRAYGRNPVGLAMSTGRQKMVKFLVDEDVEHSAVHIAAYLGNLDEVKSYLAAGGDINARDPSRLTLLVCAMFGGYTAEAEFLASKGADVNLKVAEGMMALHWATTEFLVSKGADVNLKVAEGMTALHWAALGGSTEIVSMLLDNGADVAIRNQYGGTALGIYAKNMNRDIAEMLLARGADVNARSGVGLCGGDGGAGVGMTPLHMVCASGRAAVAEVYIAHGADINAKTKNGYTPMYVAKEREHEQIVELLRKHGAKE